MTICFHYCAACDAGPLQASSRDEDGVWSTRCPKHPWADLQLEGAPLQTSVLTGFELFELTEEHLVVLSRMYVCWDDAEVGAPAIDPKRPYGNNESPVTAIGKILKVPELDEKTSDRLYELHLSTETALQIVLATRKFAPGVYRKMEKYDALSWKRVDRR